MIDLKYQEESEENEREAPHREGLFPETATVQDLIRVAELLCLICNRAVVTAHGRASKVQKHNDTILKHPQARPVQKVIVLNPLLMIVSDQNLVNTVLNDEHNRSHQKQCRDRESIIETDEAGGEHASVPSL